MKRVPCRENPAARPLSPLAVAIGIALLAVAHGGLARAQEPAFAAFPYLIFCEFEGIDHAYYFSRLDPDGRATYMTPDRQVGVISIDGVAERIGGDRPGTCSDKTLDDLRAAGQAFDLPR